MLFFVYVFLDPNVRCVRLTPATDRVACIASWQSALSKRLCCRFGLEAKLSAEPSKHARAHIYLRRGERRKKRLCHFTVIQMNPEASDTTSMRRPPPPHVDCSRPSASLSYRSKQRHVETVLYPPTMGVDPWRRTQGPCLNGRVPELLFKIMTSARAPITLAPLQRRPARIIRHSRVDSSIRFRMRTLRPSWVRALTKS